ncbi:MAG: hypothetical protein PHE68_02595 [Candidatus Peribacteraceae bacterium]|nr:hypothetical protein [Candidatus Peribacteraceae bacterium]
MQALPHLAAPREFSVVERIVEDVIEALDSDARDLLPSPGHNGQIPLVPREAVDLIHGVRAAQEVIPALAHEVEAFGILEDLFLALDAAVVVEIADGRGHGSPAHFRLLEHPAFHVFAEVDTELRRHAELDRHLDDVVGREVCLLWRDDRLDDVLLEEPLDAASVDGIAGEAVEPPADDGLGLAALDAVEHVIELLAPRLLCGHLLLEGSGNFVAETVRSFLALFVLAAHGEDLLILFVFRAFPAVFKGFHRNEGKKCPKGRPWLPNISRKTFVGRIAPLSDIANESYER